MFSVAAPNNAKTYHEPVNDARGARQSELQGTMIVMHAIQLVAEEPDFAKRMRLLARAAAVVGMGTGALLTFEPVTQALVPLAVVNGMNPTALPFSGAQSGLTPLPQVVTLGMHEGVAGYAARGRAPVLAQDARADPRITTQMLAADADILGLTPHGIIAVPLWEGETLLGVLEVGRAEGGFAECTVELLHAVAAHATLALGVERREGELRQERRRAADAQEEERKRLARDLHDGPVQTIANAAMLLEYVDRLLEQRPQEARQELRRLYATLTHTAKELRGVLFDLRPHTLETAGLAAALPHLVERMQRDDGPVIRLHMEIPERLPQHIESTIYLIIREALTNVQKHAKAQTCWVDVCLSPATNNERRVVQVQIRDNGIGFDPQHMLANYPHGQSWGLLNMYERARAITAHFAIHAQPQRGTTVELVAAL